MFCQTHLENKELEENNSEKDIEGNAVSAACGYDAV